MRAAAFGLLLLACADKGATSGDSAAAEGWDWGLPEGFPEPNVPADNPMSAAKVELGRYLFYDVRLSYNETQSCGTCHEQDKAFTDGRAQAEGSTGEAHRRGAMALANVAWASGLTWASVSVRTLEDQALLPLFGEHPVELGMAGHEDELLRRFEEDAGYRSLFGEVWPEDAAPVTLAHLAQAIAAFERSLVTADSPYDRFRYADDPGAMSASARQGMGLFFSEELECFHCHGDPLFTDSTETATSTFEELFFHNTGLYNVDGAGAYPERDQGIFEQTGLALDMGRFRAPPLRNVALTAPYMHDGSIPTLELVLDHYAAGGRTVSSGEDAGVGSESPVKSELIQGFDLDAADRQSVIDFLHALTDEAFLTDARFGPPDSASPPL